MNRKLRPRKSPYQIKEEQVNFLLEHIDKNLEEYKKGVELRDNQLAEAKRVLKGAKNSYDLSVKENKQLEEYILNIKQKFKQYQQQQQQQQFLQEKEYFQRPQKKYKKIVYEEETDSETETGEGQYVPEDEFVEQEKKEEQKQPQNKRINKIFDYLNKDTKRNKR